MNEEKFNGIVRDIAEMVIKKNRMYNDSVFSTGEIGIFVRLSDKFSRLKYLLKDLKFDLDKERRQAVNDTILDIAGYCLLWIYLIGENGIGKVDRRS